MKQERTRRARRKIRKEIKVEKKKEKITISQANDGLREENKNNNKRTRRTG